MAALVLRIKFPPTYPLIYKTLRIDANLTVAEAVKFIAETLNIQSESNIGLYLPDEKRWLDDNTPLSTYSSLQDVEHIEYKNKNDTKGNRSKNSTDNSGCCIILWIIIMIILSNIYFSNFYLPFLFFQKRKTSNLNTFDYYFLFDEIFIF
jgi:hypothetical protein